MRYYRAAMRRRAGMTVRRECREDSLTALVGLGHQEQEMVPLTRSVISVKPEYGIETVLLDKGALVIVTSL
jgi:hypothetical protein